MYQVVRDAGRYVVIHSCGDCDGLLDDLIQRGVNCYSPSRPELMGIDTLLQQFRGRLLSFGRLSTWQILPYGTVAEVTRETQRLISLRRR